MFEAFDLASKSSDFLTKKGIPKKWADIIHKIAKENIVRKKVKIKAELKVRFFTGDGVEKTKKFLNDLTNKYGVNIKYISAPKYSVEIESEEPKLAQKELTKKKK